MINNKAAASGHGGGKVLDTFSGVEFDFTCCPFNSVDRDIPSRFQRKRVEPFGDWTLLGNVLISRILWIKDWTGTRTQQGFFDCGTDTGAGSKAPEPVPMQVRAVV